MSFRSPQPHDPSSAPRWSARHRNAAVTAAVVTVVLALQWAGLRQYRALELEQASSAFARIVDQSTVSLTQQTAQYQGALLGLRALYLASDKVSAPEFASYARALEIEHTLPGLRAFAFNRDIAATEREAYTAWVRARIGGGDPAYAGFHIYPGTESRRHHVVEIIFPPIGNQRSLGYDLLSSDVRRQTIEVAHQRGFAASPPLRLQQAPNAIAVLILAPVGTSVWDGGTPGTHTVAASFLVADLVKTAIAPTLRRHFHLRISDLGPNNASADTPAELLFEDDFPPAATDTLLEPMVRLYQFGGRQWELRFTPNETTVDLIPMPVIVALILGGALMTGTISHLVQQRIRRATRNRALAAQASDCVLELDAAGRVLAAEDSATRITGRSAGQWKGHALWEAVAAEDAEAVREAYAEAVAHVRLVKLECRIALPDAHTRWIEIRLGNHLRHAQLGVMLAQISDIDARKQAELEIERLAFFDSLTQLPNRRLLEQRAEMTFSTARRHRGRAAVLVLDLDGFKQINDQAGHATGDAVLALVAQRLLAALRDSDTVARLGGDEFVILLGEPAAEAEVRAAAARLAQEIAQPLNVRDRNWFVSASIGMAMYPDHGQHFADLLSLADAAMYRSKRSGNGQGTMAEAPAA